MEKTAHDQQMLELIRENILEIEETIEMNLAEYEVLMAQRCEMLLEEDDLYWKIRDIEDSELSKLFQDKNQDEAK